MICFKWIRNYHFSIIMVLILIFNLRALGEEPVAGCGNALDFDGSKDYVSCGTSSSLRPSDSLTVEAWIYPRSTPDQWDGILSNAQDNGSFTESGYHISFNNDSLGFWVKTEKQVGSADVWANPRYSFDLNKWTHIAGTYNGSRAILYVDGTPVDTVTATGSINWYYIPKDFRIGCYYDDNELDTNYFDGKIDEVRVWNRARTASEIQQDMHRRLSGSESGLVGYWRFDELSGNKAYDSSSNSNHGTLASGMTDADWVVSQNIWKFNTTDLLPVIHYAGKDADGPIQISTVTAPSKGSLLFDHEARNIVYLPQFNASGTDAYTFQISQGGASAQESVEISITDKNAIPVAGSGNCLEFSSSVTSCATIAHSSVLSPTQTFSVEFWAYKDDWSSGTNEYLISKSKASGYDVIVTNSQLKAQVYRNGSWGTVSVPCATLPSGFHHIALTYNGQHTRLYIDGVLKGSDNASGNYPVEYSDTTPLVIGAGANTTGNAVPGTSFNGKIDEVRLWNRARTGQEINNNRFTALTGTETNLVGYWRLDETSGSAATRDFTAQKNHGIVYSASWKASDAWKKRRILNIDTLTHSAGYDPDGSITTLSIVLQPSHGELDLNTTDRTITYTPDASFVGTDTYVFKVRDNGFAVDTFRMEIIVDTLKKPYITAHPESKTHFDGEAASFKVSAKGEEPFTYQWQKRDGSSWENVGPNDPLYYLSPVTYADSGYYRVLVSNSHGADTSDEAKLTVRIPLVILEHPRDTAVNQGTAVSFSITVSGELPEYQWQSSSDGGKTFVSISGATASSYSFTTTAADNQKRFRCVVSSLELCDTSYAARLEVYTIPVIVSSLPADTVIPMGDPLSLFAQANANPAAQYTWFFSDPDSTHADSVAAGSLFVLDNASKSDSGSYFFVARNSVGSAVSDTARVHVFEKVQITLDLPSSYNIAHGSTLKLRPGITGDQQVHYQWYKNNTAMPAETLQTFTISSVDSSVHNKNKYVCKLWNTFMGFTSDTVTTTVCQLIVSKYYNPFRVKVTQLAPRITDKVVVKLWSDVDISNFPDKNSTPFRPWADSLWLLFKTFNYPSAPSQASVQQYAISTIKAAAPDTVCDTLTIATLPQPNDSCYWFNYSVLWHDSNADTLLKPFYKSGKVFLVDTVASSNKLTMHPKYFNNTDSAWLVMKNITTLQQTYDSLVTVQCSKFPDFSFLMYDTSAAVPQLIALGDSAVFTIDDLPIKQDTIYCRWFVTGKNTAQSIMLSTFFEVGTKHPEYKGKLNADTTTIPDIVLLSWNRPQESIDSIRIWWDTAKIPLDFDINLPQNHAVYPPTTDTTAMIKNLQTNRWYYFGLQICNSGVWSYVTEKASDSVKTPKGIVINLVNTVSIKQPSFNKTLNAIQFEWEIDTTKTPAGFTLEYGTTIMPGSELDTAVKPVVWKPVVPIINPMVIGIGNDILFDTLYSASIWLRGRNAQGQATEPIYPTDSSITTVAVPSFTWQFVTLGNNDTIGYAANKTIVIKKGIGFPFKDTLRAHDLSKPLPSDFTIEGNTFFRFCKTDPQIPYLTMGMRYKCRDRANKRPAIYNDSLGCINFISEDTIYDNTVWLRLNSTSFKFPFLLLTDTHKPDLTVEEYDEIVVPVKTLPTFFKISDNVSNVQWQLIGNAGNKQCIVLDKGVVDGYNESQTNHKAFLQDPSGSIISPLYGTRLFLVVTDGRSADTVNISRRVKSASVAVVPVPANAWTPVRTPAELDTPSVEAIFSQISTPWQYDIRKIRIFRYHSPDASAPNDWVEYTDSLREMFSFVPGRIIWCKSAASHSLALGSGVTSSLRTPFTITLKPKTWTDITTPYQFPIMIRDILRASGTLSDSLEIYHWRSNGTSYEPHNVYISFLDDIDDITDTLKYEQYRDAFTVYNHCSTEQRLTIPPTPAVLSSTVISSKPAVAHDQHFSSWDIAFRWHSTSHPNSGTIRCGYSPQEHPDPFFGPQPPTFGTITAGVYNQQSHTTASYALHHRLTDGGCAYDIALTNNGKEPQTIAYTLGSLDQLPDNFLVTVYNPATQSYEGSSGSMEIGPAETLHRWVVAGTPQYLEKMLSELQLFKLRFMLAYPNPFRGRLMLRYSVAPGIKAIKFQMYSLLGRLVWEHQTTPSRPGVHVLQLKTVNNRSLMLSSGVYVMRMSAWNDKGVRISVGDKKLTCVK